MSQLKKLLWPVGLNQDDFNKRFVTMDELSEEKSVEEEETPKEEERTESNVAPNQDKMQKNVYMEDLGINMKNLFFEILEMVSNGINPISYIMDDQQRQFTAAVMILIIGGLLLFFSNLMIDWVNYVRNF